MKKEITNIILAGLVMAASSQAVHLPQINPIETLEERVVGVNLLYTDKFYISLAYDTDGNGFPDVFKLYEVMYSPSSGWAYLFPNPVSVKYDLNEDKIPDRID